MKVHTIYFKIACLIAAVLLFSCSEDPVDELGQGTIIGKVVKKSNYAPLEHVKIETTPVTNTVFTNDKGEFVLEQVSSGEYSVKAELEGYVVAFKSSVVKNGKKNNVVFELASTKDNNKPPSNLKLIFPQNNQVLSLTSIDFKWSAEDPNDDDLTYTLELRSDLDTKVQVFKNIVDTTFSYDKLTLGGNYFWQVTVSDGFNPPVVSSMNAFKVYKAPLDNRIFYTRSIADNLVIFSTTEQGDDFQLTDSKLTSFRPRINRAANKIAYLQSKDGVADIFIMDRDGGNKQKVTSYVKPNGFNLRELNFSWPANSDKIYFPNFDKLYRINSNGQGLTQVFQTQDGSFISEVDVDEVNELMVLKTNNSSGYAVRIFIVDFKGVELQEVLPLSPGAASGLQFSYDASRVLYAYDISGYQNPGYVRKESRLFIYTTATNLTSQVSNQIPNGTNDLDPRFSPNEAFVIFSNSSNDGLSDSDIYIRDLADDGSGARSLLKPNAMMPEWN